MPRNSVYCLYTGYPGDYMYSELMYDHAEQRVEALLEGAKVSRYTVRSYLTTTGFGRGYFNNSGSYNVTFKFSGNYSIEQLKLALEQKMRSHIKFFDDNVIFAAEVKELNQYARRMNKAHPY